MLTIPATDAAADRRKQTLGAQKALLRQLDMDGAPYELNWSSAATTALLPGAAMASGRATDDMVRAGSTGKQKGLAPRAGSRTNSPLFRGCRSTLRVLPSRRGRRIRCTRWPKQRIVQMTGTTSMSGGPTSSLVGINAEKMAANGWMPARFADPTAIRWTR